MLPKRESANFKSAIEIDRLTSEEGDDKERQEQINEKVGRGESDEGIVLGSLDLGAFPEGSFPEGSFPEGSREWRKAQRKATKAQKRAVREGLAGDDVGRKACDLCLRGVDLLVRCTVDASQEWKMVCGHCWKGVSGGVTDGDIDHPHYKYGGLWKNKMS